MARLRRNAALVLAGVLAVAAAAWAATFFTPPRAKPVETVEVWVAAKDLPVGTVLTRADLPTLAEKRTLAKAALPITCVVDAEEMIDNRIARALLKGSPFDRQYLVKGGAVARSDGHPVARVPYSPKDHHDWRWKWVDIFVTVRLGDQARALPLFASVIVVGQDPAPEFVADGPPGRRWLVIPALPEQSACIQLAEQRGCTFQVRPQSERVADYPRIDLDTLKRLLSPDGHAEFAKLPPPLWPEWNGIVLPEGTEAASLTIPLNNSFVGPGSHVDVVGTARRGKKLHAFPILANVLVVDVDTRSAGKGGESEVYTTWLAVTKEEAALLDLARERGCHLELLELAPNWQRFPHHDARTAEAILRELPSPAPAPRSKP